MTTPIPTPKNCLYCGVKLIMLGKSGFCCTDCQTKFNEEIKAEKVRELAQETEDAEATAEDLALELALEEHRIKKY